MIRAGRLAENPYARAQAFQAGVAGLTAVLCLAAGVILATQGHLLLSVLIGVLAVAAFTYGAYELQRLL